MSNPFDDLESGDEGNDESTTDVTTADEDDEPAAKQATADSVADSTPTQTSTPAAESTQETDPSETGPAFEYSEVRQKPLYARGSTWDDFEKTFRTTIAPKLAEADVVDEETRELHDALVQLGNEQPERIAEIMLEARRNS